MDTAPTGPPSVQGPREHGPQVSPPVVFLPLTGLTPTRPPTVVWPFLPTTGSWIFGWTGPCLPTPTSGETVTPAVPEETAQDGVRPEKAPWLPATRSVAGSLCAGGAGTPTTQRAACRPLCPLPSSSRLQAHSQEAASPEERRPEAALTGGLGLGAGLHGTVLVVNGLAGQ